MLAIFYNSFISQVWIFYLKISEILVPKDDEKYDEMVTLFSVTAIFYPWHT